MNRERILAVGVLFISFWPRGWLCLLGAVAVWLLATHILLEPTTDWLNGLAERYEARRRMRDAPS